ncbi:MAG TPA: BatD family protein, partial [Burkholderiales bacterium]
MTNRPGANPRAPLTMRPIGPRSTRTARPLRALAALAFGLLLCGTSASSRAALQAQLDRTSVQDGQTLTLTIVSDQAQSGTQPDVAPLRKDFNVLGTSSSSETRIVNGSRSDSTSWQVRLLPLHTGTIDIPPIAVGSERTAALRLEVTALSPQAARRMAQHVFLEVEADAGKSVYVQQQIPYTVRLYYDDTINSGDLSAPEPADAIVELLGKEARYTTVRDGRNYQVIERHYAIAPERSGTLVIPSASFRGTALLPQARSSAPGQRDDPMSRFLRDTPLANDPFFQGGFGAGMAFGAATPVTARGREFTL